MDLPAPEAPGEEGRRRCYGYFVPDREAQRQLAELGFDLRAPKCSFDPSEAAARTCFGGAHVSVLKKCWLAPRCRDGLAAAAGCTRDWRPPAMQLRPGPGQDNVTFRCRLLATAAAAADAAGWGSAAGGSEAKAEGGWIDRVSPEFHVGLYSSTYAEKMSPAQAEAAIDCLQHAGWGWVLSICADPARELNEEGVFEFDWGSFIASTPPTRAAEPATLRNLAGQTYLHTRRSFESLEGGPDKWKAFQLSRASGDGSGDGSGDHVGSRWCLRPVWLGRETRRRGERAVLIETGRAAADGSPRYLHVRSSWAALPEREALQLSRRAGDDPGSRWGVVQHDDGTLALRSHRADLYLQWAGGAGGGERKWEVFRLHWDARDAGCRWHKAPVVDGV